MTGYSKGAAFENKVKAWFGGNGYFVVRAAGSHGPVDLIACVKGRSREGSPPRVLFIQCKLSGKMTPAERLELFKLADECGATALKAWRPARGEMSFDHVIP